LITLQVTPTLPICADRLRARRFRPIKTSYLEKGSIGFSASLPDAVVLPHP
jgi:hypothetical protein